jgi:hypothetical protein
MNVTIPTQIEGTSLSQTLKEEPGGTRKKDNRNKNHERDPRRQQETKGDTT